MNEVCEIIIELQKILDVKYNRRGLKVSFEPDIYRYLTDEINRVCFDYSTSIISRQARELKLAGPYGYILIVEDKSLGDQKELLKQKVIEYLNNPEIGTKEIEKLIPDWEIKK